MRLVQGAPRRNLKRYTRRRQASGANGLALRAGSCTSPLVQRIGMSKQLLLVRVSVDRVGQRTTEHNRNTLSKHQLYAHSRRKRAHRLQVVRCTCMYFILWFYV
jgi:hypothetical protein